MNGSPPSVAAATRDPAGKEGCHEAHAHQAGPGEVVERSC